MVINFILWGHGFIFISLNACIELLAYGDIDHGVAFIKIKEKMKFQNKSVLFYEHESNSNQIHFVNSV